MSPSPEAIPAATVILVRDVAVGPPLLLMAERAAGLAFAGGALVFPGGRVDPADSTTARNPALATGFETLPDDDAAARITAAREALEETGLLLSTGPLPEPHALARARTALATGPDSAEASSYAALLAGLGHRVDASRFHPFGIWEPPAAAAIRRRFHTRFYLVDVTTDTQTPLSPDGGEAVALHWITARGLLDTRRDALVFPTRCMLERLAQFESAAAMVRSAANHFVQPAIVTRNGEPWLTIPRGIGYPYTAEPLASARRE